MKRVQCELCGKNFNPQGLGSHMRWHRKEEKNNQQTQTGVNFLAAGDVRRMFTHILERHPQGISCRDIAVQMQKHGYKKDAETKVVIGRVHQLASAKSMRSKIVKTGRGVYRLKTGLPKGLTHQVAPEKEPTEQFTAPTLPALPVEALHLRIDHLESENNRLRRAMTMQNQTMQVLVTGD